MDTFTISLNSKIDTTPAQTLFDRLNTAVDKLPASEAKQVSQYFDLLLNRNELLTEISTVNSNEINVSYYPTENFLRLTQAAINGSPLQNFII